MFFLILFLSVLITCGYEVDRDDVYTTSSFAVDEIGQDIFFEILHPPELQYTYRLRPAKNFGAVFNSSFSEKKIRLLPTIPSNCCEIPTNAEDLFGAVALIQRGECNFHQKALLAEKAGAKAAIISDHMLTPEVDRKAGMWKDNMYIDMTHDDDEAPEINIPAGFLLGKNGRMIRDTLEQLELSHALINIPVNLTFVPRNEYNRPTWVHL